MCCMHLPLPLSLPLLPPPPRPPLSRISLFAHFAPQEFTPAGQVTALESAVSSGSTADVDKCAEELTEAGVTMGAARLLKLIKTLQGSTRSIPDKTPAREWIR